ncbi:hypothetical protein [Sphingopyxis yananensis]|jgi:hypothetical protein|uniref:hypothetical protein n=1 Tax=Sphingopyxis yananensis TaxID=2886687 RepID=UPI001D100650|nr:hypothetical protein [Sphingopyxis yananensis]MCC2602510.1 hypothetical protein [Sphingopyxis yananensis]
MSLDDASWPSRTEKRYLRRVYNGRTTPIIADGQKFLTYKQAMAHLQTLDEAACHAVVEQMKSAAKAEKDQPETP